MELYATPRPGTSQGAWGARIRSTRKSLVVQKLERGGQACAPQLLASRIAQRVCRQTITCSPTSLPANTRDASQPRLIEQARVHPPPIDAGILTSGPARVPAEDLEHRGPGCCAVYRSCNVLPTISQLSADASRTLGSTSPGIHAESSRSLVHKSHSPSGRFWCICGV
jgi:hypothetical protein